MVGIVEEKKKRRRKKEEEGDQLQLLPFEQAKKDDRPFFVTWARGAS